MDLNIEIAPCTLFKIVLSDDGMAADFLNSGATCYQNQQVTSSEQATTRIARLSCLHCIRNIKPHESLKIRLILTQQNSFPGLISTSQQINH